MEDRFKFEAWDTVDKKMYREAIEFELKCLRLDIVNTPEENRLIGYQETYGRFIYRQCTGLKDKNGNLGYYDSDIWEIKNYKYHVPLYKDCQKEETINLRFIIEQHSINAKVKILNNPKGLKTVSLDVLFNLTRENGRRMYVDHYRQRLEIIGNIHQDPHLLEAN